MRKIFFLLTTLLRGSLAFAQEAETTSGKDIEVRLIPRFELNPYAPVGGGDWDFDFGSTSLYTQIEGSIGDHVSYFFSNHWLSTDPASLYVIDEDGDKSANLFRSDYSNWMDMGYIGLTFGNWDFTIGKNVIMLGSYEMDAYDYDAHANLNSYFWNAAQVYQWGVSAAWTTPDESSQLVFQLASSPFSERPFGNSWYGEEEGHLKTFSLGWYGDFDWYAPIWSANLMEYEKGKYFGMIGLGNQFYAGDFTITLDLLARLDSMDNLDGQEYTCNASVLYNLHDKWEIFAKGGFDSAKDHDFFAYYDEDVYVPSFLAEDYWFAGAGAHWYPLSDSQDLRVHAVLAYNNFCESLSVNMGVTYNFDLTSLFRK